MNKEQLRRQVDQIGRRITGEIILRIVGLGESVDIQGIENIPRGRAIDAFNHMGVGEIIPVMALAPKSRVMTKVENFRIPGARFILDKLGFFAVNRGEADSGALDRGIATLRDNEHFGIAPEQTRGREMLGNRRQLKKGQRGVIWIAQQAAEELSQESGEDIKIPIVPWAIWGGTEWFISEIDVAEIPFGERLVWRPQQIHVRIGEPVYIDKRKLIKQEQYAKVDEVMIAIRNMLPPEYHGYYREDLVRYRKEARDIVIPRIERALKLIPALKNTTLANFKVLNEYYQVYKAAEYSFGVPWYLLWMIHDAESGCTASAEKAYQLLRYGAMGRQQSFYPDSQVEKIVNGNYFKPFYTVPLRDRRDWKEIIWAADKIHYDAYLAIKYKEVSDPNTALENAMYAYCPKEEAERRIGEFRVLREIFSN